jgi:hypothetical protein
MLSFPKSLLSSILLASLIVTSSQSADCAPALLAAAERSNIILAMAVGEQDAQTRIRYPCRRACAACAAEDQAAAQVASHC